MDSTLGQHLYRFVGPYVDSGLNIFSKYFFFTSYERWAVRTSNQGQNHSLDSYISGKNVFCRTFMSDTFVCIKNKTNCLKIYVFFFDEKSFLINMHRTIYWHLKNKIVEKVYSNMKLCIIGRPDLFKQKRTVCILI